MSRGREKFANFPARTYRDAYTPDVQVTDHVGTWAGIEDWSVTAGRSRRLDIHYV
jgi:hypothetical protein